MLAWKQNYKLQMLMLRKRRRQQWHANKALKKTKKIKRKEKKTIDQGFWTDPLKAKKRIITIADKLKVLKVYDELKLKKKKALEASEEPRPIGATRAELKRFFDKKKASRKELKKCIQKELRRQFPDIVQQAQVWKWKRASEAEKWTQLPDCVAKRAVSTENSWRKHVGVPLKGRKTGSAVPIHLQRELDILMMEFSSGLSDVSERKELIDTETLVLCLQTLIMHGITLTCTLR